MCKNLNTAYNVHIKKAMTKLESWVLQEAFSAIMPLKCILWENQASKRLLLLDKSAHLIKKSDRQYWQWQSLSIIKLTTSHSEQKAFITVRSK